MKMIIHIGVHKTGTTFLQECVFPNIKNILYYYKPRDVYSVPAWGNEYPILVSDEEFCKSMPDRRSKLSELIKLKKHFPDAKIIVGIREYESWMRSTYAQTIKTGWTHTFEQYTAKHENVTIPPGIYAEYVKRHWDDVFVYTFEDLKRMPELIVSDMCAFMQVETPKFSQASVNVSLTGRQLKYWRYINIILRGEFLRRHIESPWWILTFPFRQLKAIHDGCLRRR